MKEIFKRGLSLKRILIKNISNLNDVLNHITLKENVIHHIKSISTKDLMSL